MGDFVINTNTNRLISTKTALYRKLKKLGQVKEIEKTKEKEVEVEQVGLEPEKMKKVVKKASEPPTRTEPVSEPEFSEHDLQHKMAELTTSMVADNMKKIIKSQKLNDKEYDALLRRMLYKRLCENEPKESKKKDKPAKKEGKKAKKKFKLASPPSSESESD
jgi:hypothetical protein